MNGCNYLFHLVADTEDTYTVVWDLVCPEGKVVEFHVYSSHANHTAGTSLCTYTYAPQSGLEATELTNKAAEGGGKDFVTADINIGEIASTKHGGGILACGAASTTNDTLLGSATFKGTTAGGEPNGITISTP